MKQIINILVFLFLSACSGVQENISIFSDFAKTIELKVLDSLSLEEAGILNPHYIQYKDSFLILCSMTGGRDMSFWNLHSNSITTRNVIGQGADEMSMYSIMKTANPTSFCFADYRRGRVYEMDLEKLQKDSALKHSLLYELPIEKGDYPLRFMETENNIFGIGLYKGGRIYSFNKKRNEVLVSMEYPLNQDIEKLDYIHKGALFTGTLMVGNERTLVLSCFGLVDFYDVLFDGSLALKRTHHYSFPKFKTMEEGKIVTLDSDGMHGISDMDSNEDFVYMLYSGKSVKKYKNDAFNCSHVLVYDWDGNPKSHYILSKPLYGFSIAGNILYGLSREAVPIVYVYSLPMNMDE